MFMVEAGHPWPDMVGARCSRPHVCVVARVPARDPAKKPEGRPVAITPNNALRDSPVTLRTRLSGPAGQARPMATTLCATASRIVYVGGTAKWASGGGT